MLRKRYTIRYLIIMLIMILFFTVYGGKLLNMQIAGAEHYPVESLPTRTEKSVIPALRGEIYDRNGNPLVTNKIEYNLIIDGMLFPTKGAAELTLSLLKVLNAHGQNTIEDTLPIIEHRSADGSTVYSYSMAISTNDDQKLRFSRFLTTNKLDSGITADEFVSFLINKYGIHDCPPEYLRQLLGILYDFDRLDILRGLTYTIAEDISDTLLAFIKEASNDFPGVIVNPSYERVYNYPGVASHILGIVGSIPSGSSAAYSEKGYSMDATVGREGAEKAFEDYLRGKDGELERVFDYDGNLIEERITSEPIPGKNVYLTIDINLQMVAEKAVEDTINKIVEDSAKLKEPELMGADANAGSAVVINPNNGEILALATYPSYDLSTYRQDIGDLLKDENTPLVNRAVNGNYPPGSIFKIATSVAILSENVITPTMKIYDKGIYDKYDYQPRCWLYVSSKLSHGSINVSEALQHSCNYFYYETADTLGITLLNQYSRKLGLGVYTGIEIGETRGILASPEFREANASSWFKGDTLQAAIGQSDNLFSPLQMATMLAAVVNGGTRYSSHLLLSVNNFYTNTIYYYNGETILDKIDLSQQSLNAIKSGMSSVIESGTAASLFVGFPVKVGGKTGTAQIKKNESDLATFIAFAPYDVPEVVVSVVIEHGYRGTLAGMAAEDILGYYFGVYEPENTSGLNS